MSKQNKKPKRETGSTQRTRSSNAKANKKSNSKANKSNKKVAIILASVLCLSLGAGILAQWGGLHSSLKMHPALAPAQAPSGSTSTIGSMREYVYTGGRLSATEDTVNLALGKTATQSSTYVDSGVTFSASRAVDGNTDGSLWNGSSSATNNEYRPWWQVDLGSVQPVQSIQLWRRTDCCYDQLTTFYVFVSDNPFTSTDITATQNQSGVSSYYTAGEGGLPTTVNVNRTGRYVRAQLVGTDHLAIAEAVVWGTPSATSNLSAPTNLVTTTVSHSQINLTWNASTGGTVDHYQVERKSSINSSYTQLSPNPTSIGFNDNSVTSGTAYLYRVCAVDSSGGHSNYSNVIVVAAVDFINDPLLVNGVSNYTTIQLQHFTELRSAVNAVRATAGLTAFNWTNPQPQSQGLIYPNHINDLRSNLSSAITALGLASPQYQTPDPITSGTPIRAIHVQQLRDLVRGKGQ
ncbi:MAG: hypothetical protein AUG51_21745 [Acidobacteria bacterium 13_1_20CM_3_53_8]|nr:MAG: hypothetical protein AUG51_21745 [Acidobacteria bacterium 13_1_20CM_3_53_8]